MRSVLYVPREFDGVRKLPLIVCLHGDAENGLDGRQQLKTALAGYIWQCHKSHSTFPYFTLFPQTQRTWEAGDRAAQRALLAEIDAVTAEYQIDLGRIYLTGVDTGAACVWSMGAIYPDRWAGLVPVTSVPHPSAVAAIKGMPVRWYHQDVPHMPLAPQVLQHCRDTDSTLEFIEVDPAVSDIDTSAYTDAGLYKWLDAHHRELQNDLLILREHK